MQFTVDKSGKEYLVIVRRSERIADTQKELKKKTPEERERNWLFNLSENNNHLELDNFNQLNDKQIRLFADNPKEEKAIIEQTKLDIDLGGKYSGFYILSYEIDPSTYMIDDASLSMPDAKTLELIEIESLHSLVLKYQSLINESLLIDLKDRVGPEELSGEASEYLVHTPQEEKAGGSEEYPMEVSDLEKKTQETE